MAMLAMLVLRIVIFSVGLASGPVMAGTVSEWGGSNYVVFGLNLDLLNDEADWQRSDIFKTPTCHFQSNRELMLNDLSNLREHGQRKVALVLWHASLDAHVDCNGFLLRSTGGAFSPQVIANLKLLLQLTAKLGFDEVQIRFAPMGKNFPKEWKSWDESMFQENWSLIKSTVSTLQLTSVPRIVFDLGGELGGLSAPGCAQCPEYVSRMWQVYTTEFGTENTYSFSVAYAPGRLALLIDQLRSAGPLPKIYGIDLYRDPEKVGVAISRLAKEARLKGIETPEILIQETYYADQEMYQALVAAARQNNIKIRAIMQWPQVRGSNRKHISVPSTPDYLYFPAQ